jgi:hypothetical protein
MARPDRQRSVTFAVRQVAREKSDRASNLRAAAAFADHNVPSTVVGVTVLGYPDQLVEIEAVAIAPAKH